MISIVSFTQKGADLCAKLLETLPASTGYAPQRFCADIRINPLEQPVSEWAEARFLQDGALVFIGATGIAVRAIAPYVREKQQDPAVVALDEQGKYVIPLLSGHMGGANRLAKQIAQITAGTAVISTATDLNNCWAVDSWAKENGYSIENTAQIKHISAALLAGESIGFHSDFPVYGEPPFIAQEHAAQGICISIDSQKPYNNTLNLIPKCLTIGIGCRESILFSVLENKLYEVLEAHGLPVMAVGAIATVTRKANEPAIVSLCEKIRVPLLVYTPEELGALEGDFTSSAFVQKVTGVDNICERSAVCAGDCRLIVTKTTGDGTAIAIAQKNWRVLF